MGLAQLLKSQYDDLTALARILREEQDHLKDISMTPENWSVLVDEKRVICENIERTEKLRMDFITSKGYSTDKKGTIQAANDMGCIALWDQTQDLIKQCASLNMLNGSAVTQIMSHNRHTLEILSDLNSKRVYGANGQHQSSGGRLNISA
jgi:flagellar biosynthesis/type III secretory pathway chaperone